MRPSLALGEVPRTSHATAISPSATHDRLPRILLIAIFASLSILLSAKALRTVVLFDWPGQLRTGSAGCVYVARRVQQGEQIYCDWQDRPHVIAIYGPAQYVPVGYIGRWLNADTQGLYAIGRWISVLATAGTVTLIIGLARRKGAAQMPIAVMAGLFYLTGDIVLDRFDIAFRPDSPVCFFTLLGLAMLVRPNAPSSQYASVFVFLCAFLFKQSSVAGPAAAVLWLWLGGRRQEAIRYGTLALGVFVCTVAALDIATGGKYLLNTFIGLQAKTTFSNIPLILGQFLTCAIVPILVSLYAIGLQYSRREWQLSSILLILLTLSSAASCYRDGGWMYYYMPSHAVACVIFGQYVGEWWRQRRSQSAVAARLTLLLLLTAVVYVPAAFLAASRLPQRWQTFTQRSWKQERHSRLIANLTDYLNASDGPVFCQFGDVSLGCPKSILIDTFYFSSMSDVGVFDDSALVEDLRQGRLAAIVLKPKHPKRLGSTWTLNARWIHAASERYQQVDVPGLTGALVYLPVEQTE